MLCIHGAGAAGWRRNGYHGAGAAGWRRNGYHVIRDLAPLIVFFLPNNGNCDINHYCKSYRYLPA